jgi:hypothetical protein
MPPIDLTNFILIIMNISHITNFNLKRWFAICKRIASIKFLKQKSGTRCIALIILFLMDFQELLFISFHVKNQLIIQS